MSSRLGRSTVSWSSTVPCAQRPAGQLVQRPGRLRGLHGDQAVARYDMRTADRAAAQPVGIANRMRARAVSRPPMVAGVPLGDDLAGAEITATRSASAWASSM